MKSKRRNKKQNEPGNVPGRKKEIMKLSEEQKEVVELALNILKGLNESEIVKLGESEKSIQPMFEKQNAIIDTLLEEKSRE